LDRTQVSDAMVMTTMYRHMTNHTVDYLTVTDDGCVPVLFETSALQPNGGKYKYLVHIHVSVP
jgi:hypothetical protein